MELADPESIVYTMFCKSVCGDWICHASIIMVFTRGVIDSGGSVFVFLVKYSW